MRIAFSIILNGRHHLLHNNYYKFMVENFDYWVIAEGASMNQGSTKWCKTMPDKYCDKFGSSTDGTVELLKEIEKESNGKMKVIFPKRMWSSKDEQVNAATTVARELIKDDENFLWEVDIRSEDVV